MSNSDRFHELAKDSGNRLRAYILSMSSGATGVFFLALTNLNFDEQATFEKWLLLTALVCFVSTVGLCLYELRIDAQRFFNVAKQLDKHESERDWSQNEKFKKLRYFLLHASYITLAVAVLSTSIYLVLKIFST